MQGKGESRLANLVHQQQLPNETTTIAKRNNNSCQTKQHPLPNETNASKPANNDIEQISYHEARNFFLNQGQELAVGQKITNDKDFDKYFGLAAFMGKGGEPTRVDFANEFVLPIVLPETDCETDITAVSLSGNASVINLNYKVKVGEKRDFYIRPIMLLVVDKAYRDAQVVVNQ